MYSDLKERIKQILEKDDATWVYDDIFKVCDEYEQRMKGCIEWSAIDIIDRAKDVNMQVPTEDEAQEILEKMIEDHDCNLGITWDTIDGYLCALGETDDGKPLGGE